MVSALNSAGSRWAGSCSLRWLCSRKICFTAFLLPLEKEEAVVMGPPSTRMAMARCETWLSISLGGHLGGGRRQ